MTESWDKLEREIDAALNELSDALNVEPTTAAVERAKMNTRLALNEDWLAENRKNFLKTDSPYSPLDPNSGVYKLLAEAGRTADWDLPYEKLDLPVMVITGLQDHVFLDPAVVYELTQRLPDARRLNFPDAGHMIPAEQPEALAEALLGFAKEVA